MIVSHRNLYKKFYERRGNMGFFSNLFSKKTCSFCNNQVGALSRKKLKDDNYICKECEKNCSAFIDPCRFDMEYMKQHMEYMKKQDIL